MILGRKTLVVGNPKKKRRKAPNKARSKPRSFSVKHRRKKKGNPAYLMLLGPANPKRSKTVKKKRKNKAAGHKHRVVARSRTKKTVRRSISKAQVKAFMKRNRMGAKRRRSASNPFARSISLGRPSDMVTAAGGVLVGVFGVKAGMGFLPASVTSSPLFTTLAAVFLAGVEWWALSFISPEFGAAAGLGGIAEAVSIGLDQFGVGSGVALNGLRRGRFGDFVPASFSVPQNPVLDAATGFPKTQAMTTGAYPRPYAVAS